MFIHPKSYSGNLGKSGKNVVKFFTIMYKIRKRRKMPRGMNPNSLANLKKGGNFGTRPESARNAARKASEERRGIAEEMRALLDEQDGNGNTRRKALAAKLVLNMEKSPEWYKLGLRMVGELPPEQMEVSRPKTEIAAEIEAALKERSMGC